MVAAKNFIFFTPIVNFPRYKINFLQKFLFMKFKFSHHVVLFIKNYNKIGAASIL